MQSLIVNKLEDFYALKRALSGALNVSSTFKLYRLKALETGAERWAFTGYQKRGALKQLDLSAWEGALSIKRDHYHLTLGQEQLGAHSLIELRKGVTMSELAPLRAWRSAPAHAALEVLFWVRDPALLAEVIFDHQRLGCEPLMYARGLDQQLSTSTSALASPLEQQPTWQPVLLKLSSPSHYLIQRYSVLEHPSSATSTCLSDGSEALSRPISVLYQHSSGAYLEWGFELSPELSPELGSLEETQLSLWFYGALSPLSLSRVSWAPLSPAQSFTLNALALTPSKAQSSERAGRSLKSPHQPLHQTLHQPTEEERSPDERFLFELPLHVELTPKRRDPELWLLNAQDLQALTHTLSLVDELDLNSLQVCAQEDPDGALRFFVRDQHLSVRGHRGAQGQRAYLELGGQPFASAHGSPQLLMPVQMSLTPHLNRALYPQLFQLQPGALTVLCPSTSASQQEGSLTSTQPLLTIYQLSEGAFVPLRELLSYELPVSCEPLLPSQATDPFSLSRFFSYAQQNTSVAAQKSSKTSHKTQHKPAHDQQAPDQQAPDQQAQGTRAPSQSDLTRAELSSATSLKDHNADERLRAPTATAEAVSLDEPAVGSLEERLYLVMQALCELPPTALNLSQTLAPQEARRVALLREASALLQQQRAPLEAMECLVEALWCVRHLSSREREALQDELLVLSARDHTQGKDSVSDQRLYELNLTTLASHSPLKGALSALCVLTVVERAPVQERSAMLSELQRRSTDTLQWPLKLRWLFWLGLARLSQDLRLFERHREQLLNELNAEPREPLELPAFLRAHLLKHHQRLTELGDQERGDQERGAQGGRSTTQPNMSHLAPLHQLITRAQRGSRLSRLREPLLALMARAYHERHLYKQRDEALEQLSLDTMSARKRGWVLSVLLHTPQLLSQERYERCRLSQERLLVELSLEDYELIRKLNRRHQARQELVNTQDITALLQAHRASKLFTTKLDGQAVVARRDPELTEQLSALKDSALQAQQAETQQHLLKLLPMLIERVTRGDDFESVSYHLYQLLELSGKLRWLNSGLLFTHHQLTQQLTQLVSATNASFENQDDLFYKNIAMLALSELHFKFGEPHKASGGLSWTLRQLNGKGAPTPAAYHGTSYLPWIDKLDLLVMSLKAIEVIGYPQRATLLSEASLVFSQLINGKGLSKLGRYDLLEQLFETTLSTSRELIELYSEHSEREEQALREALYQDPLTP